MLGPNHGEIELAAILSWDVTFQQRNDTFNQLGEHQFNHRGEVDSAPSGHQVAQYMSAPEPSACKYSKEPVNGSKVGTRLPALERSAECLTAVVLSYF
jgi:hypothetical protein